MSGSKMQGSPWHVEYLQSKPGTTCRCLYKKDDKCRCTISNYYKKLCPGRGDCSEYISDRAIAKSYSESQKKSNPKVKSKAKTKKQPMKTKQSKADFGFKKDK